MNHPQDDIAVGRIAGAFGLRGELKCDPTNAGRTVFAVGSQLRCLKKEASETIRLSGVRPHKGRLLIRIEGIEDAAAAAPYAGSTLYAARTEIALAKDEYLDEDLVGCEVCSNEGKRYGKVERVEHYPSSDMLVVAGRMVPMVRAIVREIDLGGRRIVVDAPEGLLD